MIEASSMSGRHVELNTQQAEMLKRLYAEKKAATNNLYSALVLVGVDPGRIVGGDLEADNPYLVEELDAENQSRD